MKKIKRIIKHMIVPHRGNAFRPHAFRHKSLSVYLGLLVIIQLVFGVTAYSGPEVKGINTDNLRKEIITLANSERQIRNTGSLLESQLLNKAAQEKLNDMFAKNYWDHNGPGGETAWDFISASGYRYEVAGENLARGFSEPDEVMIAWMKSPTHRENILNYKFQEIGIAVGTGKIKGATTTVIVQLFGRPQTAFASESTTTPVAKTPVIVSDVSLENATLPSKTPYFLVWTLIFGLIILDGLMLRKLGLHTSPKHLYSFRVSIVLSIVMLALLSVGIAAIA
ncbi:hypothetical protein K0A96_02290 [Patescibacteria group bacterium]|nr:hypothetical protein [Patescibacteria group bacterium]